MVRVLAFHIGIGLALPILGQAPQWAWAVQVGGTNSDYFTSAATDSIGNIYVTGELRSPVGEFDGMQVTNPYSPYPLPYVAMMNYAGTFQWVQPLSFPYGTLWNDDAHQVRFSCLVHEDSIAFPGQTITVSGGVAHVTGHITDLGEFENISVVDSLVNGPFDPVSLRAMDDPAEHILLAGSFIDSLVVGDTLMIATSDAMFIVSYAPDGSMEWANAFGGAGIVNMLAMDPMGASYLAGDALGSLQLGDTTLSGGGFLLRLSESGEIDWFKESYFLGLDSKIMVDDFGHLFWSHASGDVTNLHCYSFAGEELWIEYITTPGGYNYTTALLSDNAGGALVSGTMIGPSDFGTIGLNTWGGPDVFVARIGSNGTWSWAVGELGTANVWGGGLIRDLVGNLFAFGYFENGPVFGSSTLASSGTDYFAKLTSLPLSTSASPEPSNLITMIPNPVSDLAWVDLPSAELGAPVRLIDATGRMVLGAVVDQQHFVMDFSALSPGLYILRIGDHMVRLVKE